MRDQFLSTEEMELENDFIDSLIALGEKDDKNIIDVFDDIYGTEEE